MKVNGCLRSFSPLPDPSGGVLGALGARLVPVPVPGCVVLGVPVLGKVLGVVFVLGALGALLG